MRRFVVRRMARRHRRAVRHLGADVPDLPGDPQRRPGARGSAGRLANAARIAQIRKQWGFDKPIYVQYVKTMEQIFTGTVVSYTQGVNVLDQIRQGLPATLSLAIGAGYHLAVLGGPVRRGDGGQGGPLRRQGAHRVWRFIGRFEPAVLPWCAGDLLPRLQGEHHPAGRLRAADPNPVAVVHAPDRALAACCRCCS